MQISPIDNSHIRKVFSTLHGVFIELMIGNKIVIGEINVGCELYTWNQLLESGLYENSNMSIGVEGNKLALIHSYLTKSNSTTYVLNIKSYFYQKESKLPYTIYSKMPIDFSLDTKIKVFL
jgi:hypothetical protein